MLLSCARGQTSNQCQSAGVAGAACSGLAATAIVPSATFIPLVAPRHQWLALSGGKARGGGVTTAPTLSVAVAAKWAAALTSEEARLQAQVEGLTLRVAKNTAGYFGVVLANPGRPKPFQVQMRHGGELVHLGSFATAEEAALCVARSPEGQAAAGRAAAAMSRGAWLPAVPSGAIPREKGTALAMAPGTEPVVKVDALLLLLDDDIALDECIGRHGRDDALQEEEGSEDAPPKRQRMWNEFF